MMMVRFARRPTDRLSIVLPPTTCADCDQVAEPGTSFLVVPPHHRPEGAGRPFWMCERCWDRISAAALLNRLRGY